MIGNKIVLKIFSDVIEDENNMKIIKLLLRLDEEVYTTGGYVRLLGNHELMNVDKDFRYVSPQKFIEFVPQKIENQNIQKMDIL